MQQRGGAAGWPRGLVLLRVAFTFIVLVQTGTTRVTTRAVGAQTIDHEVGGLETADESSTTRSTAAAAAPQAAVDGEKVLQPSFALLVAGRHAARPWDSCPPTFLAGSTAVAFPSSLDRSKHAACSYRGNPCNHTEGGNVVHGFKFTVQISPTRERCGRRESFTISAAPVTHGSWRRSAHAAADFELKARLVTDHNRLNVVIDVHTGDGKLAADGSGVVLWRPEYTVLENGCFYLQIRVAWHGAEYLGHDLPDTTVCFRHTAKCPAPVRLCSRQDFLSGAVYDGRWVPESVLHRSSVFYPNSFGFVHDECGFNTLVWAPRTCLLRSYDATAVRDCLGRRGSGSRRIGISMGDSIPREQYTNLIQLLAGSACFTLDGRVLACGMGYCTHDTMYRVGEVEVIHVRDVASADVDVMLLALPVARTLAGLDPGNAASLVGAARGLLEQCHARNTSYAGGCFFFMNSANHRPREDAMFAASLNGRAVRQLRDELWGIIRTEFPSVPVIDAYALSASRWYASWDGIHHTRSIDNFTEERFSCQWQGGVSAMTTLTFLNAMMTVQSAARTTNPARLSACRCCSGRNSFDDRSKVLHSLYYGPPLVARGPRSRRCVVREKITTIVCGFRVPSYSSLGTWQVLSAKKHECHLTNIRGGGGDHCSARRRSYRAQPSSSLCIIFGIVIDMSSSPCCPACSCDTRAPTKEAQAATCNCSADSCELFFFIVRRSLTRRFISCVLARLSRFLRTTTTNNEYRVIPSLRPRTTTV